MTLERGAIAKRTTAPQRQATPQSHTPPPVPSFHELTFKDIERGVAVDPEKIEIWNGTVEGFECRNSLGIEYLVTLYRPALIGSHEENNNPPEKVSLQTRIVGASGEHDVEMVEMFSVPYTLCDEERRIYSENLAEVVALLQNPEQVGEGIAKLEHLVRACALQHDKFITESEELPIADMRRNELRTDELSPLKTLVNWLSARKVPYRTWGKGEAKFVDDLLKEVMSGEGTLLYENGQVYLENKVVLLWLETPDGKKRLVEHHQTLKGGRRRTRRNLGGLPAEKMEEHEHPASAVQRLLEEELGIKERIEASESSVSLRLEPSQCYPGIIKRNRYFIHRATLPEHLVNRKYVERKGGKETVFTWIDNPEYKAERSQASASDASARRDVGHQAREDVSLDHSNDLATSVRSSLGALSVWERGALFVGSLFGIVQRDEVRR